jgi:hypothetical protein
MLRLYRYEVTEVYVKTVDEIERAIHELSEKEYAEFREWFLRQDFRNWDHQIQQDSDAGKLDFLVAEARTERSDRSLSDL